MRRLYECLNVNVPSDSTMNVGHYAMGFVHYSCAGLVLVMEAPMFVQGVVATLSRYAKCYDMWKVKSIFQKEKTLLKWFDSIHYSFPAQHGHTWLQLQCSFGHPTITTSHSEFWQAFDKKIRMQTSSKTQSTSSKLVPNTKYPMVTGSAMSLAQTTWERSYCMDAWLSF